jgi:hypothetical protein
VGPDAKRTELDRCDAAAAGPDRVDVDGQHVNIGASE